jgi:acetyl-CoA carboxylase alpha subunit
MEKENDSKIEKLEKQIKKLKKRPTKKLTKMKFVGIVFEPEKYKTGEAEINDALSNGFEVIRDFQTGSGIVMALGKWEKENKAVKKEWNN